MASRVWQGYDLAYWELPMSDVLILVPARYESSRFPGKPLAKIHGKSMISYIISNCENSGFDFAIVTDHAEIAEEAKRWGAMAVRIDDEVPSGSERIALAYERFFSEKNYQYVVNMQGDEPLMSGSSISKIVGGHKSTGFDIFTGVKKHKGRSELFSNPNIVKAAYSEQTSECFYFSRASIPYDRQQSLSHWYQHIGIYCYRVEALRKFQQLAPSPLELTEQLEQLRALENGMRLGAKELELELIGVDTPADIARVEGVLE